MSEKVKKIVILIIPIIIFTLALLTFYPGILSYDSYNQWQQVQTGVITDAHPFLTTYVMLLLSKIYNSPITVFIFQIILFSSIWTYLCTYIRKVFPYKKDIKYQIIFTIIMCLFPIYFIYAITLWKDIIYSYVMLLISILLFVGANKNFKYSILEMIILGISLSLAILYRHNAIIAITLVVITLLIMMIKKKISYKMILLLFISIVSSYFVLNIPKRLYLEPSDTDITVSSFTTSYSIFALSTFYNNNVEFDEEDLELLNTIIPEETWRAKYDKYLINTLLFSEDLNHELINEKAHDIEKIFIKYSLRYPQYFILHYLQADSMLYNPAPFGSLYVFEFSDWKPYYSFDHNTESKLPLFRKIVTFWINITYNKPYILRVILYRPIYPLFISILLMILMIRRKWLEKRYFISLTPMIYNTVSLLPINIAQDLRYVDRKSVV